MLTQLATQERTETTRDQKLSDYIRRACVEGEISLETADLALLRQSQQRRADMLAKLATFVQANQNKAPLQKAAFMPQR